MYDYPKPNNITVEQKNYLQTFINDFETALYGPNYADEANGYKKYIDVDSFIDYFIINELARNNDGFKKSSYFYKDKDSETAISKLHAGPVWDFDWAWKNINECSIFAANDGSGWAHHINDCNPDVNSPGWYIRLMEESNFKNKLRCRWDTLRATILSADYLNNYIDATALYLNAAQQRHFERWGNLGVNTGTPETDADPTTFSGQITKFKNWVSLRLSWLDANIPGSSASCNLAVETPIKKQIRLYPNPAKDHLFFNFNDNELPELIEIFDISGKSILKVTPITKTTVLDISALSNGIYICSITGKDFTKQFQKITILH